MLTKQEKQAIMKEYATKEGDTGSPEVQIAVLTADINKNTVDFAWNMLFAPWYSTHDRKHSGDQHCWTLSGT